MNLPNPPNLKDKGLLVWLNRIHDAVLANRPVGGRGIRVKQGITAAIIEAVGRGSAREDFHPFRVYPATLKPTDDHSKPWRYWSVRGGYISNRPGGTVAPDGNTELSQPVLAGADGVVDFEVNQVSDYFTSSVTPDDAVTVEDVSVGNSGDFTVSSISNAGRFIINSTLDGIGAIGAAFWAEATNPTPGQFDKWYIKCRMWAVTAGGTGRTASPYPSPSPNVIPIATLETPWGMNAGGGADPLTVIVMHQLLNNHLINRYPPGAAYDANTPALIDAGAGPMFWRGYWDSGDTLGLSGQYFYAGDVVTVQITPAIINVVGGGGGAVQLPDIWQSFIRTTSGIGAATPPLGDWQPISGFV